MNKQTQPLLRSSMQKLIQVATFTLTLVVAALYFLWARHHLYLADFNAVGIFIALSCIFGVFAPYIAFHRPRTSTKSPKYNAILSVVVSVAWILLTVLFTFARNNPSNIEGGHWMDSMGMFAFELIGYVLIAPLVGCAAGLLLTRSFKEDL